MSDLGGHSFLFAVSKILANKGDERNKDDEENQGEEVAVGVGDYIAKKIAHEGDGGPPEDASHDVVGKEFAVVHGSHSCDNRNKSTDRRNETGKNDGFSTVALGKLARVLDARAGKPERILACKEAFLASSARKYKSRAFVFLSLYVASNRLNLLKLRQER